LDQQVLAFFTHILPCLAKTQVSVDLHFNGSDAKQSALLNQLLNIFRDGLPTNKLHAYASMADIQYLPDIDNKMQKIGLYMGYSTALEFDIPFLMKMLASPRSDGQQRVIHFCHVEFPSNLLEAIKEVKNILKLSN
jgi:hypothetical protein